MRISGASARIALFASVIVVSAFLSGASAASSIPHKLEAKPAVGLKNRQVVKVSGSGFKPHDLVFLVECLRTASGQNQCDTATATLATITSKGVFPSTPFKVVTGKVGGGHCGTNRSNLKDCVIDAGNETGTDTATVTISFKEPQTHPKG
jgi:Neocarzinostatin family